MGKGVILKIVWVLYVYLISYNHYFTQKLGAQVTIWRYNSLQML
jgi:hypothetical protein